MFGDLGKIIKLVGDVKTKLPEMREKLADSQYTAVAGGEMVTATVNGKMQLVDLKLSEHLLEDENVSLDMLEDLIKTAVSAAQSQAAQAVKEAVKELTGGMDLPGLSELM